MSGDARCVNNGAAPSFEHRGDFILHRIQDTPNVDIESPAILFFGDLIERPPDLDTGIVEGDIEAAVGGQDEVDRLLDVGVLGDIRANKCCDSAGLVNLRGDLRASFSRRPVITTFAPASAKASAVALPIPEVAPVMRTTLLV